MNLRILWIPTLANEVIRLASAEGETVTIEQARVGLPDVVSRAQCAGERVVVTRRGKPAAIVSMEDLELLRRLEDEIDAEAIREALEEARDGKALPWSEVRESLPGRRATCATPPW